MLQNLPRRNVLNGLLFNAAWLACVLGGNVVAVLAIVALLLAHFRLVSDDWRELVLALQALVIGFFVDAMLLHSGILIAPDSSLVPPLWLLCLWIAFSTTLNHSLAMLKNRFWLAFATGLLLVPLSYLGGTRLTDYELSDPIAYALLCVGACWALVLPLLAWFAVRNQQRFTLRPRIPKDA